MHHPDKLSGADDAKKEEATRVFQRVGFAYTVLRDESRRKRYVSDLLGLHKDCHTRAMSKRLVEPVGKTCRGDGRGG